MRSALQHMTGFRAPADVHRHDRHRGCFRARPHNGRLGRQALFAIELRAHVAGVLGLPAHDDLAKIAERRR